MDYLADTVTIIRQFSKSVSIGKEARNILPKDLVAVVRELIAIGTTSDICSSFDNKAAY